MTLPAVYFVPHQDDETLSMSVDILRHIAAGRETHIVLFTDGGNTGARYVINGYNENTGQLSLQIGGVHVMTQLLKGTLHLLGTMFTMHGIKSSRVHWVNLEYHLRTSTLFERQIEQ